EFSRVLFRSGLGVPAALRLGNDVPRVGNAADDVAGRVADDRSRTEDRPDLEAGAGDRPRTKEAAQVAAEDVRMEHVEVGVAVRTLAARPLVVDEEEHPLVVPRRDARDRQPAAQVGPEAVELDRLLDAVEAVRRVELV